MNLVYVNQQCLRLGQTGLLFIFLSLIVMAIFLKQTHESFRSTVFLSEVLFYINQLVSFKLKCTLFIELTVIIVVIYLLSWLSEMTFQQIRILAVLIFV